MHHHHPATVLDFLSFLFNQLKMALQDWLGTFVDQSFKALMREAENIAHDLALILTSDTFSL